MMRGGEIFVPKIPSTDLVTLARAMAPNVGFRSIGIRPGEKLHEVMISEDDARSSVDLGDRYAIKPEYRWWDGPSANIGGTPVPEGFIYASKQNEDTLTQIGRAHV